jgi:hypothetical protein
MPRETLTKEQIREKNRLKTQYYREKKRAALSAVKQTPTDTGGDTPLVEDEQFLVEVKADLPVKAKPTLRERLGLGGGAKVDIATPAKRRASKKVDTPNLVVTVLPTLTASLIAAWAKDRLPEEYQACAPSRQEVKDIIGPLLDILGDEIEVAAKVSQNTLRLINSLICTMAYGTRAYVTYVEIKKSKESSGEGEKRAASHNNPIRSINHQTTGNGAYRDYYRGDGNGPDESIDGIASNGAGSPDDDTELRHREAALVANLFKRDRIGREQLGLLPRTV